MEAAPQVSSDPQKPTRIEKNNSHTQKQDLTMQWSDMEQAWICTLCQKRCRSKAARNKHLNKDCENLEPQNPSWKMGWDKARMGCRYCGQIFRKRKGIRVHLQQKRCPEMPNWNLMFGREPPSAANKKTQNQMKKKWKLKQKKKREKAKREAAFQLPAKIDESDSSDEFDGEESWVNPLKDQPAHGSWREHQQEAWSGDGGSHHQPAPSGCGPQTGQPQTSSEDRHPPQLPGHDSQSQCAVQADAQSHMPPLASGAGPMLNSTTGAAGSLPSESGGCPRQAAQSTGWPKEDTAHVGSWAGNNREETGPACSEQEPQRRPGSGNSRDQYDQYCGQGDGGHNPPSNRQSQVGRPRIPTSDDCRSRSAGLNQEGSSQRGGYSQYTARSRSPVRETGRETVNAQNRRTGYKTRYSYPSKRGQERNQVSQHHKDNYQMSTQDPRDYRGGDYRGGDYRGSQDRGSRGYPADRRSSRYPY